MHENREISSTPWSDDQGRSAKATSRTADTHVLEKSDCAVVPVNQPNQEGQLPSAELGEGRAQTKENIAQSHMHPTQSGKRMSQGLDGVRKVAKERKQERFSALLHHLSVEQLRDSFFALQRKASPGIDGVTWAEYETGPVRKAFEVDLVYLIEDRHHGLLNDFVLPRRDAQRTLPPVGLRNKDSS
jgi:RNA-directed DNA polymerase